MNRRDALRMLTAGTVLPALTPELFAFYQQAHPSTSYTLRTLNPRQNDTIVAMIDQILPATDTPGAKAARANEFIDIILTEWANDEERGHFLDGLADVDKQSNALFSKNSADTSPEQQLALLRAMDDAALGRPPEPEHLGDTLPERSLGLPESVAHVHGARRPRLRFRRLRNEKEQSIIPS